MGPPLKEPFHKEFMDVMPRAATNHNIPLSDSPARSRLYAQWGFIPRFEYAASKPSQDPAMLQGLEAAGSAFPGNPPPDKIPNRSLHGVIPFKACQLPASPADKSYKAAGLVAAMVNNLATLPAYQVFSHAGPGG